LKINSLSQEQFHTKDNHAKTISLIQSSFDKANKSVFLVEKTDKPFWATLAKGVLIF
jgi:hypothetical protein